MVWLVPASRTGWAQRRTCCTWVSHRPSPGLASRSATWACVVVDQPAEGDHHASAMAQAASISADPNGSTAAGGATSCAMASSEYQANRTRIGSGMPSWAT